MRYLACFTVFLALNISNIAAQTVSQKHSPLLEEASPEKVRISPERLSRIDQMCKDEVREGRKLRRDDIYRIASQSKAITSTAVMMLWEEGRFQVISTETNE